MSYCTDIGDRWSEDMDRRTSSGYDLGLVDQLALVPRRAERDHLARGERCATGAARVGLPEQLERRLLDEENAALIARLRVSREGQEGLTAFLDKRKPSWIASGPT